MEENLIIAISREYGSGGREVGRNLARRLGFSYLDKEAVIAIAKDAGVDPQRFLEADVLARESRLYALAMGLYTRANRTPNSGNFSMSDELYTLQAEIIRSRVEVGPLVVVGLSADRLVQEHGRAFRIFLHAPIEQRARRLVADYGVDPTDLENELEKLDRRRGYYYNYHTGRRFGQAQNYDFTLSTANLTVAQVEELLLFALESRGFLPPQPQREPQD